VRGEPFRGAGGETSTGTDLSLSYLLVFR
jgi:hypothetical protein